MTQGGRSVKESAGILHLSGQSLVEVVGGRSGFHGNHIVHMQNSLAGSIACCGFSGFPTGGNAHFLKLVPDTDTFTE